MRVLRFNICLLIYLLFYSLYLFFASCEFHVGTRFQILNLVELFKFTLFNFISKGEMRKVILLSKSMKLVHECKNIWFVPFKKKYLALFPMTERIHVLYLIETKIRILFFLCKRTDLTQSYKPNLSKFSLNFIALLIEFGLLMCYNNYMILSSLAKSAVLFVRNYIL